MIWVDAHLSPGLAAWITAELGEAAHSLRDIGLRDGVPPVIPVPIGERCGLIGPSAQRT